MNLGDNMNKIDLLFSVLMKLFIPTAISIEFIKWGHEYIGLSLSLSNIYIIYKKITSYNKYINYGFLLINIIISLYILKIIYNGG